MKKIGVVGTIGHIGMGRTVLSAEMVKTHTMTVEEQNKEDLQRRSAKELVQAILMRSDSSKCKKGHSYQKVEQENGSMPPRPKWVCTKCQREL
jgi:transposase-like protein